MTKMKNDGYEFYDMDYNSPDRSEGINYFHILFRYGNSENEYTESIHFEESHGKLSYVGMHDYNNNGAFMFKNFWLSLY